MSSYFTKHQTHNDSNIPIPKRSQSGIKKSKRCAQLPELQRYIETIIKASNECDSEDTSLSDKDKFPKDRKFGKYSVFKGLSTKITQDKINDDLIMSRNKSYNKAKTPIADVVSRDDKIYNTYAREFEDPRNWKFDKNVYLGPKPEIEMILKKFYPNPFHLESENKGEKDDLTNVTSPDDVILKTNTEVNIEKTVLLTADNDIKCKRDVPTSCSSSEKRLDSQLEKQDVINNTTSAPTLTKKSFPSKVNHSSSNSNSRVSSLESVNTFINKESTVTLKNRKQKSKTKFKSNEKNDYDIGKLKFLSSTDSENCINTPENPQIKKSQTTDQKNTIPLDILSDMEFGNIREIYNIMNRATESILLLESKDSSDNKTPLKMKKDGKPSKVDKNTQDDKEVRKDSFKKDNLKTENSKKENILLENNTSKTSKNEQNLTSDTSENDPLAEKPFKKEKKEFTKPEAEDSQKIDEVVDFIYDCLKKFSSKEKPEKEQPIQESDEKTLKNTNATTSHSAEQNNSQSNPQAETSSESMTLKPKQLKALDNRLIIENRWTNITRLKCKKQLKFLKEVTSEESSLDETPSPPQIPVSRIPEMINLEPRFEISHESNDTILISTAESQNELGSYTEEPQIIQNSKLPKSNLPLPAKLKSKEINTCKTLIDALGEQERQLSERQNELQENLNFILENQTLMTKPPSFTTFCKIAGSKQDILICSNSGSQYILQMKHIQPTPTTPVSLSLNNISQNNQPKPKNPEFSVIKLFNATESWCRVFKRVFENKREALITIIGNKPVIAYNILPVCQKTITNITQTEECSKTVPNLIQILVKVSELTPPPENATTIKITEQPSEISRTGSTQTNSKTDLHKEVTETTSQKNSPESKTSHCDSFSLTTTETKDKSSQSDTENENYRKKVHELLLRAHSLEQKLQKCLQIMTCLESTAPQKSSSQERVFDDIRNQLQTSLNLQSDSLPLVHWHLKPSENKHQSLDETTKTDHGTNYDPPVEETPNHHRQKQTERTQTNPEKENEDEVGELSDSSFKSSNDAQTSEHMKSQKEKTSKKLLIKNILNHIESYKQNTESKTDNQKEESERKPPDRLLDNQLIHYDPKTPAKVLKTVFKGKRSLTELTIGLKDVPMTKVGNISVERTKNSPNHTKISICITQNKSENKFPPYIFDQVKPSISSCLTDFSRTKDNLSKSSQSDETDEENEDDEEDYKSVASTLSHSEEEEEGGEQHQTPVPSPQKPDDVPKPKNITKHRFEFYRKMNSDLQSNKSKRNSVTSSVCRYNELEPLKQALTEMQIRMRSIKRDALFNSNEYYERALKLAKMSAGFCQSCGNRTVIPNDTFGYYRSLLPGKSMQSSKLHHIRTTIAPNTSFCTFPSTKGGVKHQFSDLGLRKTSCSFHPAVQSNRTIFRSSLRDMPIVFERV